MDRAKRLFDDVNGRPYRLTQGSSPLRGGRERGKKMKLSFSIKYWEKMDWPAACQAASDAKLNGLEIDSIKNPGATG